MNVPRLRFKEFTYQWEERVLGDIFTFKNGVNASKEQYGSGFRFINVLDIINNNFITYENIIGSVDIADEEFTKNEVKYGDVLFQRSSETREEVGQSNVYIGHQSVTFGGFVIRGRGIAEYDPIFFNYVLKTDSVRDEITQRSGGSTRYNIGQDALNVIPILLPTIHEQTKIANFLTAIDEKISQLTQKCDLLKQYKKGVMQQIFSQKLRFKDEDGREFPEWEELNFDEGFYLANNKKTQIKSSDYFETGHIPVVDQGQKRIVGYTNNKDVYNDVPVIIFGDHTRILKWIDFKFAPGADGTQVIKTTKKLNLKFGYYCLCNIELPNLGYSRHMKEMKEQYFFVPASIKEQTKIANFLTAIDDKITHTQTQLDAVKQYKKGLLQQLFV